MSACPVLESVESKADADFKAITRGWLDDYKVCKLKHDLLVECLEHNNQVNKKAP